MKTVVEDFIKPLYIDETTAHGLSRELCRTFKQLSASSSTQFLPTPISESILRPAAGREKGRGGTNLRAGFIELLGNGDGATNGETVTSGTNGHVWDSDLYTRPNIRRLLEKSWPINEHFKNENADSLFAWIGRCIAETVSEGCKAFDLRADEELPMGVTFSFPMVQDTLANATLMPMGKGFAITSNLDLGTHLLEGYEKSRALQGLPRIRISAILNDAVATMVSFIYSSKEDETHKAAMGLICGTGSNATIPLSKSTLRPDKLPGKVKVLAGDPIDDIKVCVNTEWSINGTAPALRQFGLINKWDSELDANGEAPGFQPLEYMTAGRYLGELGRLMLVDYLKTHLHCSESSLPARLLERFGLTTTFLSRFRPLEARSLLEKLEAEFPQSTTKVPFRWTEECAVALYQISKAIELRAAGITAASIVGLLASAGDIPLARPLQDCANEQKPANGTKPQMNLIDYLADCQSFLDSIMKAEFGEHPPVRVVLSPCHDGGITGAGVLYGEGLKASSQGRDQDEVTPNERTALLGNSTRETTGLVPETYNSSIKKSGKSTHSGPPSPGGDEGADVEAQNGSAGANHEINDHDTQTYLMDTDKRRFWIVYAGIMLTYSIAIFDGTIMASSHPVITSYFNAANSASWTSTAFLLTTTAIQPVLSRLSDTIGRKIPYLSCMIVFCAATLWCALAQSMTSFIIARAVCGFGAGGMMSLGNIMIGDLMHVDRRAPFQSFINIIYGIAASCGAAFGGVMADGLGWRWEFGIQVFPVAVCWVVGALGIPRDLGLRTGKERKTIAEGMREFDFRGSALTMASTTLLILGLNLGGNVLPWSHPLIITALCAFAVVAPVCVWSMTRAAKPIMPLELLHTTPRANIVFANFIASFLLNAIMFNAPIFFQAVLLTSATTSGLYLIASTITSAVAGFATGFLIQRTRRLKWPLVSGTCLFLLGTACLASMKRGWPTWAYLICLIPGAAGQGFQMPGTQMAMLRASRQADMAVVSATIYLWRSLGNVLGIACTSLVLQNALLQYLQRYITTSTNDDGERKDEAWKAALIERVRSSVEAVAKMQDGEPKDQVVSSYEAAVRVTFLVCVGIAAVSVLLILPIRLPRLGDGKPGQGSGAGEVRQTALPCRGRIEDDM
ncbi:MFS general substrate transporter [Xylariaceae sp. FL0016]|nr:MFS general substrate transporter [Xylariaceae sp. FL0016]